MRISQEQYPLKNKILNNFANGGGGVYVIRSEKNEKITSTVPILKSNLIFIYLFFSKMYLQIYLKEGVREAGQRRVEFFFYILLDYFINAKKHYIAAVLLLFTLYSLHIVNIVVFSYVFPSPEK